MRRGKCQMGRVGREVICTIPLLANDSPHLREGQLILCYHGTRGGKSDILLEQILRPKSWLGEQADKDVDQ